MTLIRELADHVLETRPERAATVLERFEPEEAVRLLARGDVSSAATVVRRLSPPYSSALITGLPRERAARILDTLAVDVASRLMRRLEGDVQSDLLARLDARLAKSLRAVLRFPEGSAGALMDPDVLALPQELLVREALQRVRKAAESARYNVYVLGADQVLVGAITLRELLIARARLPLSDVMIRNPHRISATAGRASVLAHPGWKEVHALPVVDETDAYLGAIRYRTLREIEGELAGKGQGDADAGAAFGQVIAAGARGLIDALSGAPESGRNTGG